MIYKVRQVRIFAVERHDGDTLLDSNYGTMGADELMQSSILRSLSARIPPPGECNGGKKWERRARVQWFVRALMLNARSIL